MSPPDQKYQHIVKWIFAIELTCLLAACGGGRYFAKPGGNDAPKYDAFTFATSLASGAAYSVTVQTEPAANVTRSSIGAGAAATATGTAAP